MADGVRFSICCTLPFAETVRGSLDVVRRIGGPQKVVAYVASQVEHPCLLFAKHSIFSKIKHNILRNVQG